jgi:MFS family permease
MKKPSLLIIFLTVFIDLIGFGIVLPLLPRYSERFGAEGFEIGAIISSFSLMQFFFSPWWGRLSDRIGRRPVLLVSNGASAVSYALFAVASLYEGQTGLLLLLVSRVAGGICGANLSVASAYIADVTTTENRSKGMGMIGMAFGLGFILGPAIGAWAAGHWGLQAPGWVAAGFCAANFVLGCFILVESRVPGVSAATSRPKFSQWRHTLANPRLALLIGIFFLATFCFTCFETTLPLLLGSAKIHEHNLKDAPGLVAALKTGTDPVSQHLRSVLATSRIELPASPSDTGGLVEGLNRLLKAPGFYDAKAFGAVSVADKYRARLEARAGKEPSPTLNALLLQSAYPAGIQGFRFFFDETAIGWLFAYCGLMAAFIQGGSIGRLVKRFGEPKLIWTSLVLVAVSLVMIPLAASLGSLLFALGLFAVGSGINRAPTMGMISSCSSADEQGANLGVAQSFGSLARILGPVFSTTLYARSGALPYFLCGGIALAAGIIALMRLTEHPVARPEESAVRG